MRNLLLALMALAGGVLVYYLFEKSESEVFVTKKQDPAQKFQALIDQGSASASEIAALCERYPQIAQHCLPNTLLRVNGTIKDFRLIGVGKNVLEMQLASTAKKPVCLRFDLQKYNRLPVWDSEALDKRFEVVGHEVLFFTKGMGNVIYRRGQQVAERARFAGFGVAEIRFDVE